VDGIFDTSAQGGAEASPITIKEGLDKPTSSAVSAIAGAAPVLAAFLKDRKNKGDDYSPAGAFAMEVAKYTDAVAAGEMSPNEANARIRSRRSMYIANNPQVNPKDFFAIQKEAAATDKVLTAGNEQYVEAQAIRKRAYDQGFLMPGMSQDREQSQIANMLSQEALARNVEEQTKLMDFELKNLSLTAAQRAKRKGELEDSSRSTLVQTIGIQTRSIENKAATILERTKLSRNDPNYLDKTAAEVELSQLRYQLSSYASGVAPYAGGDFVERQTAPINTYLTRMTDVVSGKVTKEALDNELSNGMSLRQLEMTYNDPELAQLAAFDALFKNSAPIIGVDVAQKELALHVKGSNGQEKGGRYIPELTNVNNAKEVKGYLALIKEHDGRFKAGNMTPEEKQQLDNQHASMIKTLGESPNSRLEDLIPMVNYLAGPEFKDYIKTRGGLPVDAAAAKQVLNRQYRDQLLPLLKDKLYEKQVILNGVDMLPRGKAPEYWKPLTDYVSADYNGNSVIFSAVVEPKDPLTAKRVQAAVDSLNKEVAPHMTKMTNLAANFNNSNPKEEWAQIRDRLMPAAPENKMKGKIDRSGAAPASEPAPTGGLTQEEMSAMPELDPEDAKWVKAATTLAEKKRRAERLGIPMELIEKATRGQ